VLAISPMFAGRDPFTFHDPQEFNPSRPDSSYTLFGYGLHECIGTFLGRILLVEMATQLFMLRGLERDRDRGRPVSHRSAPKRFILNFLPVQPPLRV
jgi:cytochrome P450